MTDQQRLLAMRQAAVSVVSGAGIPDNQWHAGFITTMHGNRGVRLRVQRGMDLWVCDLWDSGDAHFCGDLTPLALAVLDAMRPYLWEE